MEESQAENANDPFNLLNDPYLARGPTGTFHCKKCLTTHPTEANYLIHRDGRRHKAAVDRAKKYQELASAQRSSGYSYKRNTESQSGHETQPALSAPLPVFEIVKAHYPSTDGWMIRVIVEYPNSPGRPAYRLMSMHEQKVETTKDLRYMFLVIACPSFRSIAIKIPNTPKINRNTINTTWEDEKYSLLFNYHGNEQHLDILTRQFEKSETTSTNKRLRA